MTDDYFEVRARSDCAQLIAAFAYHVDHHEFEAAVDLFAHDGVFERPDLTANGRLEIAAIWSQRPRSLITRHLCSPPVFLEVSESVVKSVTNFTLYMISHDAAGLPPVGQPTGVAEFHDEFRREDGKWLIWRRRAVPVLMQ